MAEQRLIKRILYMMAWMGVDYGLTGQYDLIVLDVMSPKIDGFGVAWRLRTNSHRPF